MDRIQKPKQNSQAVPQPAAPSPATETLSNTTKVVPRNPIHQPKALTERGYRHAASLVAIGLLTGLSNVASAITFSGTASGSWLNPDVQPTDVWSISNNDLGGNAIFTFGEPPSSTSTKPPASTAVSAMFFDGVGSDGDPAWSGNPDVPFRVGILSYNNEPTSGSATVKGVDLAVKLTITSPLGLATDFLIHFKITVTPNTGGPLESADIVTVSSSFTPAVFEHNGIDYTLQLLGFSSDGGTTLRTDFTTQEGAKSNARLYAQIAPEDIPSVPDNGMTLAMMGIGLAGVGASMRFLRIR